MNNFLTNAIFSLKKPKIVIVAGRGSALAAEAIFRILGQHFKTVKIPQNRAIPLVKSKKDILIFKTDEQGLENEKTIEQLLFLIKNSSFPILAITHLSDIPPDRYFFATEKDKIKKIELLAKAMPATGHLILNFDDETVRSLKKISVAGNSSFGLQEGADFRASDIHLNHGSNFKINYKGNIVPVWLKKLFGKGQYYAALCAISAGMALDLNLIKISQALRNYSSLPGRGKLIKGIKNSWILDDSKSSSIFSMTENLKILKEIEISNLTGEAGLPEGRQGRKIAVLGDIVGVGEYTIEAHETIGENTTFVDLLFTVGQRAKFIAEGARIRGLSEEKILQFNTKEEAIQSLKDEIREGDLVLIDGSKEMEMGEITAGIKADETVEKIKKV